MQTGSLEDELKRCLTMKSTGEAIVFEVSYPKGFLGFEGHFPDDPILPGVCIIQSIRIGLEEAWRTSLRLVEIAQAKFVSPTRPGDKLLFTARQSAGEGAVVIIKTKVTRGAERVAELTINLERIAVP
jgi:3-hydroxyacyl-[acyl-carrier-protein] dehydratase